jgi:hypothetical protein
MGRGGGERCITFIAGKRKGKRPLMSPTRKWKDFKEDRCGMDATGS